MSLALGVLVTGIAFLVPGRKMQISDYAGAGLAYASIAFGACVTAAVLALSIAPRERVLLWSRTGSQRSEFSHYSDLLFTLTWAACAQLAVIMVSLGGLLFGGGVSLVPPNPLISHVVALASSMTIFFYAIMHLFTVVATLSQIGYVTIAEAQRDDSQVQ